MTKFFHSWIRALFTLDLRALAVFRIGLAVCIIIDLTMGAMHLRTFFTDAGILPTDLLVSHFPQENMRSFHAISGSYLWQLTLLILFYLIALWLLLWRRTKLMHLLARAFFCSLSARNPLINSGADTVMRVLLFWAMFLPTHIWRSIDTRNKPKAAETTFFSRATIGLVIQIASVYLRNNLLKTDPQRTTTYTATYTAMSIDMLRTQIGTWFYTQPTLMYRATKIWITLEWWWLLLLLIPRKQAVRRTLVCLAFIAVHIGMALTMKIGYFPRVCALMWLIYLPPVIRSRICKTPCTSATIPALASRGNRSYARSAFLILCIIYITLRNLRTTEYDKRVHLFPQSINKYGFLLRIDQYRNMFAPFPLEDDGWFVITGKTTTGGIVNLLPRDHPVSYEKPTDFSLLYPGEKRRKYFLNMRNKDYAAYRPAYLQRQCRERNRTHPALPLVSTSMEYVVERTKPNYQVQTGEVVMLATQECEE